MLLGLRGLCAMIPITGTPSRFQVLSLLRSLLRQAGRINNYNFREHAHRRVLGAFRENKNIVEDSKLIEQYQDGLKQLDVVRRQAIISSLYPEDESVIERANPRLHKHHGPSTLN